MCKNDNSSGASEANEDNLALEHNEDFAHYLAAPTTGALIAVQLLRCYKLTEDRAYEVKDALVERRAKLREIFAANPEP